MTKAESRRGTASRETPNGPARKRPRAARRLLGVLQVLLALPPAVAAAATLVNLLLIIPRPETISVVNVMIGQGVLVVCLSALAWTLLRRGVRRLR